MSSRGIVLYLHVHQPWRVKPYSVFDIASDHEYFHSSEASTDNKAIFDKVARKSYMPMNATLLRLLQLHPEFRVSLSISGSFIEQAEQWAPEVLDSFKQLVDTGRVEIVAETYHHSLAFFYSRDEFEHQVKAHRDKIWNVFGVKTNVFRNTELSYNDELGKWADEYGFKGILAEGWDPILEWRSPNQMYKPPNTKNISLLLKNYRLSDDIAFRFSNRQWEQWPLTVDTYTKWAHSSIDGHSLVNLFMDYETFGEHQWHETGIFSFFETFVSKWLEDPDNTFYTVSEAIETHPPVSELAMPQTVTWADTERDLTAWTGNAMQQEVLRHLYDLESPVLHSGDARLIKDWRLLQTSDHMYYMCTKWFNDGDVHAYFSPYESPYDAFLYYMNALRDIRWRVMNDKMIGGIHG